MKHSDLITVSIPYYKRLDYLQQALDSVYKQTMLPAEIVIIDNSKEDDMFDLLQNSPVPIRHIRVPSNLALAVYFNQCLDAARTSWCTIFHADDIMHPDYIKTMDNVARQNHEASGLFCKANTIDPSGKEIFCFKDWYKNLLWFKRGATWPLVKEKGLGSIVASNFIVCPTMCYHIPQLKEKRFSAKWNIALDLDLNGRILLENSTLVGINRVLYSYRRHADAASSLYNQDFEMLVETKACIDHLISLSLKNGWQCKYSKMLSKLIHSLHVIYYVTSHPRLLFSKSIWKAV